MMFLNFSLRLRRSNMHTLTFQEYLSPFNNFTFQNKNTSCIYTVHKCDQFSQTYFILTALLYIIGFTRLINIV